MNTMKEQQMSHKPLTAAQWGEVLDACAPMAAALEALSLATATIAIQAQSGAIPSSTLLRMLNICLATEGVAEARAGFESYLLAMAINEISQHPKADLTAGTRPVLATALKRANQAIHIGHMKELGDQLHAALELRLIGGQRCDQDCTDHIAALDTTATSAIPAALAAACHGISTSDPIALQALSKRLDAARSRLCTSRPVGLRDRLPAEVQRLQDIGAQAHCSLSLMSIFISLAGSSAESSPALRPLLTGYSLENDPRISPFAARYADSTLVSPGINLLDDRRVSTLIELGSSQIQLAKSALEQVMLSVPIEGPSGLIWCASQLSQALQLIDQPAHCSLQVA